MSGEDLPQPEGQPPEPTWGEKVLGLSDELHSRGIPYAFGGAISLNYHREPRSTLDIDINVFVAPEDESAVLDALGSRFDVTDDTQIRTQLREQGQSRTLWGGTFVDIFLANTDFHASMAERVVREPFGTSEIPVLSIEDLLICKVLFDRQKDWVDIEAVIRTEGDQLDHSYMISWLDQFLAEDDPRHARITDLRADAA